MVLVILVYSPRMPISNASDDANMSFVFFPEHVKIKFGVDYSVIRTAIRTKLNNEDKLLKKRLGYR